MRPIIYPYKFGSAGARVLANELKSRGRRAKRVREDGNYKPFSNHLVINWGSSILPDWMGSMFVGYISTHVLNDPVCVATASNKLTAFIIMEEGGVQIPEFTTDPEVARGWLFDGTPVVSRYKLTGHSGEGIVLDDDYGTFVNRPERPPLYVKYIKKSKEFRVHVFKGKVIDVQQKRKRQEVPSEEINYQVRNHSNGWVYCRDAITPDQSILDHALDAVNVLGLDFGAVDIIWNDHYCKSYVLEVNTAPGLEGTSVQLYANAIEELL